MHWLTKRHRQVLATAADQLLEPDEEPPLPSMPTAFYCGSRQKIEVMRERAERGEAVFHPDDAIRKVEKRIEAFQR